MDKLNIYRKNLIGTICTQIAMIGPIWRHNKSLMNLTLLDTNEMSVNDIDRDPFGNKLNQNYSVIGFLLDTNLIDRDPFGQVKSI